MKRVCILSLFVLCSLSCEPYLNSKVSGKNIPIFRLSGTDSLNHLFICSEEEESRRREQNAIWQIAPDKEHRGKIPIEITYGIVPEGYIQLTPKDGQSPPPLISDKEYTYHYVRGLGGGGGAFKIQNGKVVEIH
jgi:hypothetical protein